MPAFVDRCSIRERDRATGAEIMPNRAEIMDRCAKNERGALQRGVSGVLHRIRHANAVDKAMRDTSDSLPPGASVFCHPQPVSACVHL